MNDENKDAAPSYADGGLVSGTAPASESGTELTQPKATKSKAPAKPKRVKMRNTKAANGTVGDIAQPLEKDVPVWEKAGWVRA